VTLKARRSGGDDDRDWAVEDGVVDVHGVLESAGELVQGGGDA